MHAERHEGEEEEEEEEESNDVPEDAPEGCPGTTSEMAGKSSTCVGCPNQAACASGQSSAPDPAIEEIKARMSLVKHKILVLSGKGGVGKSTVASQVAMALSGGGNVTGLLDIDVCGPSAPRMLGVEDMDVHQSGSGWQPVWVDENLCVMSIGFMLPSRDDAVVWRGVRKIGLIKQVKSKLAFASPFLMVKFSSSRM